MHCDLPKALRRDLTFVGGLQDLGSDMGPSAGFAARQTVANLLKNSTQKRSGRCVQHLATPQGAKNGSRESTVNPSKRLLADSKVEYELHNSPRCSLIAQDVAAMASKQDSCAGLAPPRQCWRKASVMIFSAGGALFDDFRRDVRAMSRHFARVSIFRHRRILLRGSRSGRSGQIDHRCLCPIVFPSLRFP
ncbi:hypothetical protein ABIB75_005737 [Bradyrhizobium sp. GM2.2]